MQLSELQNSQHGIITKVRGRGAFRKRITEMGFIKGKKVTVIKNAPLKDPIEYRIMNYQVSLRRSEASLIEVIDEDEAKDIKINNFNGTLTEQKFKASAIQKSKNINIALVGNPNCGKTTLFNIASKSKEHVGNYGGVTIDSKSAVFRQHGYNFNIIDLPGTYSLSAYSPEELFVRNYIMNDIPDLVINVVDASNLERNLYLTTQLIDMDIKTVIALNMYDELKQSGNDLDYEGLGKLLGIPVVPTVSSKGKGIIQLFQRAIDVYEDREKHSRHVHINYGRTIEKSLKTIQDTIYHPGNLSITDRISSRFLSLKLLEKDDQIDKFLKKNTVNYEEIRLKTENAINKVENDLNDDSETLITDAKYGFISGALRETFKESEYEKIKWSQVIDSFMTHRILGFPIFILFMWIMFQATFSLGQYPMNWIEAGIAALQGGLDNLMQTGPLKNLLIDGIIGGVGGVLMFLPNILILFFFISLMEDTGYMARASFIMDKIMHKIGLHGKSFIPLIMGFGCNVPAIMSTRIIENKRNRLLTILINPFMSCSARLPVYVLIISAFFPDNPGTMLFLIYIIGIAMASLIAILFNKTILKGEDLPFVMELPPYRMPTFKSTMKHMWNKAVQYLQKMGGVILIASIIIWALSYYPRPTAAEAEDPLAAIETEELENQQENPIEQSYIARIGKSIDPVLKPLGFDWKMGVALLTGIAAKEIVVSTLAVLYNADEDEEGGSLKEKLRAYEYEQNVPGEKSGYTPLVAFGFLMFVLVYFPCVAVIAAVKNETGSWKWAAFMAFYTTGLAWFLAFIVHQVGSLFV